MLCYGRTLPWVCRAGQILESPTEFWLQPMLINTHAQSGAEVGKHVSGPVPKLAYGGEPNQTVDRQCVVSTLQRRHLVRLEVTK